MFERSCWLRLVRLASLDPDAYVVLLTLEPYGEEGRRR